MQAILCCDRRVEDGQVTKASPSIRGFLTGGCRCGCCGCVCRLRPRPRRCISRCVRDLNVSCDASSVDPGIVYSTAGRSPLCPPLPNSHCKQTNGSRESHRCRPAFAASLSMDKPLTRMPFIEWPRRTCPFGASFSACDRLGWDLDSKSKPQLCVDVGEVCGTLSSSPFMASGNSTI